MADEKTPEQLAAEAEAARQKEADKAAKAAEKERLKQEKADRLAKEREEKKAKKEQEKKDREEKRALEAQAKIDAKATQAAEREANRQPESNGVRRPKPETATGKVWALADAISAETGEPARIKPLLERGLAQGLNDATIKTQYARWRKHYGVEGRLASADAPAAEAGSTGTEGGEGAQATE